MLIKYLSNKVIFPLYKNDWKAEINLNKLQKDTLKNLNNKINSWEYKLIENKCICWNNTEDILISEKDRYGLPIKQVLCKNCWIIRSQETFDEKSNENFYINEYRNLYTSSPVNIYFNFQVSRWEKYINIIKNNNLINHIKHVWEEGCWSWWILKAFKSIWKEIIWFDYWKEYIKYGISKWLNLHFWEFSDENIKKQSLDLLISSHVFEHYLKPNNSFFKLLSYIKLNWFLIFEAPWFFWSNTPYKDFQNAHVIQHFNKKFLEKYFNIFGLRVIYSDERCTFLLQKINNIDKITNINIELNNYWKEIEKIIKEKYIKDKYFLSLTSIKSKIIEILISILDFIKIKKVIRKIIYWY